MLKNVDKLLTGDLLKILCDMGHGDELVIADANFPAETCAQRLIRMPGIDGVETLRRLKEMPGNLTQAIPVIALTANAVSGAREEYIAAGFTDYLTKPINSVKLEEMMLKYLPPEKVVRVRRKAGEGKPPQAERRFPSRCL